MAGAEAGVGGVGRRGAGRLATTAAVSVACILLAACGTGGGGGSGAVAVTAGEVDLEIRAAGGEGTAGEGGVGGSLVVFAGTGSGVRILTSGAAVDPPPEPPPLRPRLGENPLIVSSDRTLTLDGGTIAGSANPGAAATGLHVKGGATLTVEEADPEAGFSLFVPGGIVIEGTVRGNPALRLAAFDVLVAETGRIETAGLDVTSGGGDGGTAGGIAVSAEWAIVDRGTIDASGGDGRSGGSGGEVLLASENGGPIYGTGTIDSSGGAGRDGSGGGAGAVRIVTGGGGSVFMAADVLARGGAGRERGGDGGAVAIGQESGSGAVAFAGTIDSSGGDALEGSGGSAGEIRLIARGGGVRASGRLLARGGGGAGEGSEGGSGGPVLVGAGQGSIFGETGVIRRGVLLAAGIETSGGRAARGGRAGKVLIGAGPDDGLVFLGGVIFGSGEEASTVSVRGDAPVVLAGYRRVDVSGGRGATRGGDAAASDREDFGPHGVIVGAEAVAPDGTFIWGGLVNEVEWVGRGGEGGTEEGGKGAFVLFASGASHESRGAFDLRGGAGARGGDGGNAIVVGGPFENLSPIDVSGGRGGEAGGGRGGGIILGFGPGESANAAPLRASGGASEGGEGGGGGLAFLLGGTVRTTGDILCNGGDGLRGGPGGSFPGEFPRLVFPEEGDEERGSGIFIYGAERWSEVSGTLGVRGGRGEEGEESDGAAGRIRIDGFDVELTEGEARF